MAVFTGSFLSAELKRHTSVSVILPHDTSSCPSSGFPVLYLLHGKTDDNNSWLYRSNIERYASERGLCVIMPDVELSFYSDMVNGSKYFSYVLEELPEMVRTVLHVSMRREDTYIAGVSMGGYGALKCAFTKPEKYGGCIALSPVTDIAAAMIRHCEEGEKQIWRGICGESLRVSKDIDLFRILEDGAGLYSVFPKLYIACGVSGATQHVTGMMGSDYIVAINKDEDAPIFDIANVGIVGNVLQVIPEMIAEIKKMKA